MEVRKRRNTQPTEQQHFIKDEYLCLSLFKCCNNTKDPVKPFQGRTQYGGVSQHAFVFFSVMLTMKDLSGII